MALVMIVSKRKLGDLSDGLRKGMVFNEYLTPVSHVDPAIFDTKLMISDHFIYYTNNLFRTFP